MRAKPSLSQRFANPKSVIFRNGGVRPLSSVLSSFRSRCAMQCSWQ
jgi:hypothetical protein